MAGHRGVFGTINNDGLPGGVPKQKRDQAHWVEGIRGNRSLKVRKKSYFCCFENVSVEKLKIHHLSTARSPWKYRSTLLLRSLPTPVNNQNTCDQVYVERKKPVTRKGYTNLHERYSTLHSLHCSVPIRHSPSILPPTMEDRLEALPDAGFASDHPLCIVSLFLLPSMWICC